MNLTRVCWQEWEKRFWSNFSDLKVVILNFYPKWDKFCCIFKTHFHFISGQFQDLACKVIVKYMFYKIYLFRIYEYMWIFLMEYIIQFRVFYQYCRIVCDNFLSISNIKIIIIFYWQLCSVYELCHK